MISKLLGNKYDNYLTNIINKAIGNATKKLYLN